MEAEAKDVEAAQPAAAPPRDRKDSLSVRRQSVRKFSDAAPITRIESEARDLDARCSCIRLCCDPVDARVAALRSPRGDGSPEVDGSGDPP